MGFQTCHTHGLWNLHDGECARCITDQEEAIRSQEELLREQPELLEHVAAERESTKGEFDETSFLYSMDFDPELEVWVEEEGSSHGAEDWDDNPFDGPAAKDY